MEDTMTSPGITATELRLKAIWIRDTLEPAIASFGQRTLNPNTVLELNDFFAKLQGPPPTTLDDIISSRIHKALLVVSENGMHWPAKLIDACNTVIQIWEENFGRLEDMRTPLYERGGRLHGIAEPHELDRHALVDKWINDPSNFCFPGRACEWGHLEFQPGQWWINPLFAFHDGIIDSPDPRGGICADGDGAYAITLTGGDEIDGNSPELFTYRCRNHDQGRYRLVQMSLPPKRSVRVLRSHTLYASWNPSVGVRYEGLYKIIKYSLRSISGIWTYEVTLQRESDQIPMKEVLKRPTAEETDDYLEYKRLQSKYKAIHLRSLSAKGLSRTYETDSEASGMLPMARSPSEMSEEEAASMFIKATIWPELHEISPRHRATRYQPRSPSDNRGSEVTMSASTASQGISEVAQVRDLPVKNQQPTTTSVAVSPKATPSYHLSVAQEDDQAKTGHKNKGERKDSGYFLSSSVGLSEALKKL